MPTLKRLQADATKDDTTTAMQERSFSVNAPGLGGLEIRPSRAFVWMGQRTAGQEWILPLDRRPRLLKVPRRRRYINFPRGYSLSYLGNPAVTLWLFGYRSFRKFVRGDG